MARFYSRVLGMIVLGFFLSQMACSKISGFADSSSNSSLGETPPEIDDGSDTPTPPFAYIPLLWETRSEGSQWSNFLLHLIQNTLGDIVDGADDMTRFCPAFKTLTKNQKINVWGMLFSGISKYESGFNPLSRMQETTMGTDPITGLPVFSEGLLQLSYQDIQGSPFCKFDWNKDKYLSPTDPNKTILNPLTNLDCGARIMAQQIARKKNIVLSSGVYWAVIKEGGRYEKIANIASLVRERLSYCH